MKSTVNNFNQLFWILAACCIFLAYCSTQRSATGNRYSLRQVKNKTLIPEGIAVHPYTGKVYLSSLHKNKIVAVEEDGALRDVISSGQEGFLWGLGMKFSGDGKTLWACTADGKGRTALYAIDHNSSRIIKRYSADSARFLNDLVVLHDGRIFLTDTELGAVFLLQHDSLQLFVKDEQLKWANGIAAAPDDKTLFVASGRYGLQRIDLSTRTIRSATANGRTDYAIDGLVLHNRSLYAAIGWPQDSVHQHRILRYRLDDAYDYVSADTVAIAQAWLQCPTTLALRKNNLYALSTMSLGMYNRHAQKLEGIMDSLQQPLIAVFNLPARQ